MSEYQNYTQPVPNTNRQIALLAAAQVYEGTKYSSHYVVVTAKDFLKFLEGES